MNNLIKILFLVVTISFFLIGIILTTYGIIYGREITEQGKCYDRYSNEIIGEKCAIKYNDKGNIISLGITLLFLGMVLICFYPIIEYEYT